MARSGRLLAVAASAGVLLAGCGGGDSGGANGSAAPSTVAGAATVSVRAQDPKYAFDKKEYAAKAGAINFELTDDGKENHNLRIQGVDSNKFKLAATPGKTVSGSYQLNAGTYTIYCDLTGHRAGGMEAKLVVS